MTNSPTDLLTVRQHVMALTGLTDPADVGIVGDGMHQHSGGYHEGRDVLAGLGALWSDYSVTEYDRDRTGLTNSASALDIALAWPNGGRAAGIRFTNLMVADLIADAPGTESIRAINYTPDGVRKRRRDKRNGLKETVSSDTVDIHTHFEFFRDTEGSRNKGFQNLVLRRIRDAIGGVTESDHPAPAHPTTGDDMPSGEIPAGFAFDEHGNWLDPSKAVAVPLPAVGTGGGQWGEAWLWLAATGGATVRHGVHQSGAYHDWADSNLTLLTTAGPIGLAAGSDALILGRRKASATDTADSAPVRWHVQYAA